ncbi:Uncharacterized protein DAT39_023078, partial [Clarias magur]
MDARFCTSELRELRGASALEISAKLNSEGRRRGCGRHKLPYAFAVRTNGPPRHVWYRDVSKASKGTRRSNRPGSRYLQETPVNSTD